jgi:hypothetical protein
MRALSSAVVSASGSLFMAAATIPQNMPDGGRVFLSIVALGLTITGFVAWVLAYLRDKDPIDAASAMLREQFAAWLVTALKDKDRT